MRPCDTAIGVVAVGDRGRGLCRGLEARGLSPVCTIDVDAAAGGSGLHGIGCLVADLAHVGDEAAPVLDALLAAWAGGIVFADASRLDERELGRIAAKVRGYMRPADVLQAPAVVLAASSGGPPALRRFFAALPGPPPATLVVAQHIGGGFTAELARQLGRVAGFPVAEARPGDTLLPGRAWVCPVDRAFVLDPSGRLAAGDGAAPPVRVLLRPCIDDVATAVAVRFGADTAMIVFTGMGEDGAEGARAIHDAGGTVWAQSADSAVVASMPNAAAARVAVRGRGTPETLAAALTKWLAGAVPAVGLEHEGSG